MTKLRDRAKALGYMMLESGLDPRRFANVRYLSRFRADLAEFKSKGGKVARIHPIISDYASKAGTATGAYFHQDLLVASLVHAANPRRHIDVGSLVNGFVAHVASFRRIELIDIRPLPASEHENLVFTQADLMKRDPAQEGIADSVSCLHAIEHFGLGRYGDSIDPQGHITGFRNIARMVEPGGTFYISFPIGTATEVQFNAQRVFHHRDVLGWFEGGQAFDLQRFDYVDDAGNLHKNADIQSEIGVVLGCGIYTFVRRRTAEGRA